MIWDFLKFAREYTQTRLIHGTFFRSSDSGITELSLKVKSCEFRETFFESSDKQIPSFSDLGHENLNLCTGDKKRSSFSALVFLFGVRTLYKRESHHKHAVIRWNTSHDMYFFVDVWNRQGRSEVEHGDGVVAQQQRLCESRMRLKMILRMICWF